MPPAVEPNAAAVRWGAGTLYAAPLGSTEPTDHLLAWDAAWLKMGYTQDGHEQVTTPRINDIEVAEELEVIARVPTRIDRTLKFNLAEVTLANLQRVYNGGTLTPLPSAVSPTSWRFDPPTVGNLSRIMLGWQSDDSLERWIWRRVFQTGAVTIPRKKGVMSTISTDWTVEKPALVGSFAVWVAPSISGQ